MTYISKENREDILNYLQKRRRRNPVRIKDFDECFNLIVQRENLQKKIDDLNKEITALILREQSCGLYVMDGGAYCEMIEKIYDLKSANTI